MQLKMFRKDELDEIKKQFQFFSDTSAVYMLNLKTKMMEIFPLPIKAIPVCFQKQTYYIPGSEIDLWISGLMKEHHLFEVHNAAMMARLNGEKITYDSVEKYL